MKSFSIIVPVFFKEDPSLSVTGIKKILKTLQNFRSEYIKTWELIVVIDGKNDELFKKIKSIDKHYVRAYQYNQHQGKGYALLFGYQKSSGRYITFIDCDGDISLKQILNFLPYLATADIVVGSKRHPFSKINYPLSRRIMSRGFQIISYLILGSSLRDTQSGLKIIKREVLDIISSSIKIKNFSFDLELCFLAQKHGFRVVEAPIEINFQGSSTVKLSHAIKMFWDIIKIKYWFSVTSDYQKKFTDRYFK